jgi:simple sugar transport system ATP-binding protein
VDDAPILAARGITKRFPGVLANDAVSLDLRRGEVHSLLGENGAGKSTLVNIFSGMLKPDAGEIQIEGRAVSLASPHDAIRRGIGTVYQHFTLVPTLSIAENVLLGQEGGPWLDLARAAGEVKKTLEAFELPVDPRTPVRYLSLGQQQRVEIIKTLQRGSRILLLDEPTSILTPAEVGELFRILARLKREGVAVVFITHKLQETIHVSDRVTVLRQGRKAGELGPEEMRADPGAVTRRIVEMMFGGQTPQPASDDGLRAGPETVLELQGISVRDDRGAPAVRDLTLDVRGGEILGIAGVDGNGQKQLAEAIAGQRRVARGRVRLRGADITNAGTPAAVRAGIGYVTDDRMEEGTIRRMSLAENLILREIDHASFGRGWLLDWKAIERHAAALIDDYAVRTPGPWARVGTLSGGNVQKLLLARELSRRPRVLVCNQPTHGLDVFTAERVLSVLRQQAREGTAVVLISSDLDEVLENSDRVGVMYNGRLLKVVPRGEADRETVGRLMLGMAS